MTNNFALTGWLEDLCVARMDYEYLSVVTPPNSRESLWGFIDSRKRWLRDAYQFFTRHPQRPFWIKRRTGDRACKQREKAAAIHMGIDYHA